VPPAQPIKAARGLRDIPPSERAAWRLVERAAHRSARSFGYQEIEVPVIERIELIERGVGADTDVSQKEVYRLATAGDATPSLVLRPEATASVVRAYFETGLNQEPQPVRLYLIGAMFRHDRPQWGRYRQFYQFDVEVIGDGSPAWDAEVIELSGGWLEALGLGSISLELNSIGDANCRPAYLEKLKAYYRPLKEHLHTDCQRRVEENPLRLFDCKEPQCQPHKAAAPRITDNLCDACAAAFGEVRRLLDAAGIEYRLNPHLVRGLDYYTRTVFEFHHQALGGAQNSLGGGGRYDGLAAALGFPDTPAVGFAGGIDRAVLMLGQEGQEVVAEAPAEILVLPHGEDTSTTTVAAAEVARIARTVVSAAADYSGRGLRAKMRAAGKAGYRWVALLDPDQAVRRVVQLRDMASGEQQEVAWEALPELLGGASGFGG
jgi:histidyl-tRNA synthetase